MKIKNLNDIKKSINITVLMAFSIVFFVSTAVLAILYNKYRANERALDTNSIYKAVEIYQSNLSEKITIVASSTVFLDFLESGKKTQTEILPDFLFQLSTLSDTNIVGIKIISVDNHNLSQRVNFVNGFITPNNITLKLCYLGNILNPEDGQCKYLLTLFFDEKSLIDSLRRINPNLTLCTNCQKINFINKKQFGSFALRSYEGLFLNVQIREIKKNILLYDEFLLIAALIVFAYWNKRKVGIALRDYLEKPIIELNNNLNNGDFSTTNNNTISEISFLSKQLENWQYANKLAQVKLKDAEVVRLASQVAHDIRSPLAALDMAVKNISGLPENQRITIRNSSRRINDIANNLINQCRKVKAYNLDSINDEEITSSELIFDILDNLLSEKRVQYLGRKIEFSMRVSENAYGSFAKVNPVIFKSVFSNLINNAVEAITNFGNVTLLLTKENCQLKIVLIDTGYGISLELMPKVGEGGVSFGKTSGLGLGLSTSIQAIESWGGSLSIKSIVDKGTEIEISLPESLPGDWFASAINVQKNSHIIILDDDESIHRIWENRFVDILKDVIIFHYTNASELIKGHNEYVDNPSLYLIDYELVGSGINGLDLLEKLNITKTAMLVTSRYEDIDIRYKCKELGVKIIPKNYSPYIDIKLLDQNFNIPDIVFVDDDYELAKAWRIAGELAGVRILTFNSVSDFWLTVDNYPNDMIFYIDSDLGGEMTGQQLTRLLYENGFFNLYLATGYDKSEFKNLYWLKDVVDKIFPF